MTQPLRLLLVEPDPVFRAGLEAWLAESNLVQGLLTATSAMAALRQLAEGTSLPDVVVLEAQLGDAQGTAGLTLVQTLKARYPHLPIVLLTGLVDVNLLAQFRQAGVEGYCPKVQAAGRLAAILQGVHSGQAQWPLFPTAPTAIQVWIDLRRHCHTTGLAQIDSALASLQAWEAVSSLTWMGRQILQGRQRELRAARWLVDRLWNPEVGLWQPQPIMPGPVERPGPPGLRQTLAAEVAALLEGDLANDFNAPLETDVLRPEKKQELCRLILHHWQVILEDIVAFQMPPDRLAEQVPAILLDLWQRSLTDFIGKYYTLELTPGRPLGVVAALLPEGERLQEPYLSTIPLVPELLAYELYGTPLVVDGAQYPAGSPAVRKRACLLLQNLVLRMANAVTQPILNRFGDAEPLKQRFFDPVWMPKREVERLRNRLSQEYRLHHYFLEPRAIFTSRYRLLCIEAGQIRRTTIYASRAEALGQLTGIPYLYTLLLEFQDAVTPVVQAVLAYVGRGMAYILTRVIGRGLGLVGRGIIQGVGSAFQERPADRRS